MSRVFLDILEFLEDHSGSSFVTAEIADALRMNKSTVSNVMTNMRRGRMAYICGWAFHGRAAVAIYKLGDAPDESKPISRASARKLGVSPTRRQAKRPRVEKPKAVDVIVLHPPIKMGFWGL